MTSLIKNMVVFTLGLLAIEIAPSAHAQGRMGMGRQMMMNGGLTGVNGLAFNPFLARGRGWGLYDDLGYGYGLYGEGYPADYSSQDNSYSKHKIRKYRIEEPTLSPEE